MRRSGKPRVRKRSVFKRIAIYCTDSLTCCAVIALCDPPVVKRWAVCGVLGITPLRRLYAQHSRRKPLQLDMSEEQSQQRKNMRTALQREMSLSTTDPEKRIREQNEEARRARIEADSDELRHYAFHTPVIHAVAPSIRSEGSRKEMEKKMNTKLRQQIQCGSDSGSLGLRHEATASYAFTLLLRRSFSEPLHPILREAEQPNTLCQTKTLGGSMKQNIEISTGLSIGTANQEAPPGNNGKAMSTGNGASPQHQLIVLNRTLTKVKGVNNEKESQGQ